MVFIFSLFYRYTLFTENDQQNSAIKSTLSNSYNSSEVLNSSSSNVIGKLVKVKFSKSRKNPIITPLVSNFFSRLLNNKINK